MTAAKLELVQIRKSFGEITVLDGVSLRLGQGEIVSVLGPSGSGKSTILSILTGGQTFDGGSILVSGKPLTAGERPFAFMPQHDLLLPWRRTIDNAAIGLEVQGWTSKQARTTVQAHFETFGLAGTERLFPQQLSGGMRQRVSLLRTVAQDREVLLLDEPLGALDAITRNQMQQWLLKMWESNRWSILLITHDIREAVLLSDRVFVLSAKPAQVVDEVEIPREIPRGEGFLLDSRVPKLEARLHAALMAGGRQHAIHLQRAMTLPRPISVRVATASRPPATDAES